MTDNIAAIFNKVDPDLIPEMTTDQPLIRAFGAGTITREEFETVARWIQRRDTRNLRYSGYDTD
jgi:hypothetical protein